MRNFDLEELFYNKELSDVIRDVTMNSAIRIDDAYYLLKDSTDLKNDSYLAKEFADNGFSIKIIERILEIVNGGKKIDELPESIFKDIGYLITFGKPDSHNDVYIKNSFNKDNLERLKSSNLIKDFLIDDIGVKVIQ